VATERPGLPEEWDPRRGGSSPLSPKEEYISGSGHAEKSLARAMLARGYEPIEVGPSTTMCFECFLGLQGDPFNLVKSDIGARIFSRGNHSSYRLMVRPEDQ
jgi:hypothetical protein